MKNLLTSKKYELFLFLVIILSAIFLRYYNYNYQDFWWDELMEFSTSDPTISLKETYTRAHNLTVGTSLSYDYATNANLYFYIYKFFLKIFSYTPGSGRLITATIGLLVFFLSTFIYKKFIGKNYLFFSILISFNYYLIIQSQEFKYNIFFCFISLLTIFFFFLSLKKNNSKITFLSFLFLFLTIWTHIFGFLLFFCQILVLLLKKRNYLIKNLFYYFSLPLLYIIINFKQLRNILGIKEFHVPYKQIDFFLDFDFKYFFGSLISGKFFLLIFIVLLIINFKKLIKSNFEIFFIFLFVLISYSLPLIYSYISKPILETRYLIFILPIIVMLLVYMIENIQIKFLKNFIIIFLVCLSSSNTVYSLYFLKKNDKPHISQVLNRINQSYTGEKIYVATSNNYLLNYLEKKKKFKIFNIKFISCEHTNYIDATSYWEIVIFPGNRFSFCEKKLGDLNINSKSRIYKKEFEIIERYARGKLIFFN
jgi:hypothetical protein